MVMMEDDFIPPQEDVVSNQWRRFDNSKQERARRPHFDMQAMRLKEFSIIIRDRHGETIPWTDDVSIYVEFLGHTFACSDVSRVEKRLLSWCNLYIPEMPLHEIKRIAEAVTARPRPRRFTADAAAIFLNVTYDERTKLDLTTIGACDVDKAGREEIKKEKNRVREKERGKRKRLAAGCKTRKEYEKNSLSQTKPWEHLGISRSTYYRRLKNDQAPKRLAA
jgi:hypothetical protein